jgi:hypothetical protein
VLHFVPLQIDFGAESFSAELASEGVVEMDVVDVIEKSAALLEPLVTTLQVSWHLVSYSVVPHSVSHCVEGLVAVVARHVRELFHFFV